MAAYFMMMTERSPTDERTGVAIDHPRAAARLAGDPRRGARGALADPAHHPPRAGGRAPALRAGPARRDRGRARGGRGAAADRPRRPDRAVPRARRPSQRPRPGARSRDLLLHGRVAGLGGPAASGRTSLLARD